MSFFERLKQGLSKTRNNLTVQIERVFGAYKEVDDEFMEGLEEALILADAGARTAESIVNQLRDVIFQKRIKNPDDAKAELRGIIAGMMASEPTEIKPPAVILVVGVNGVGKTTNIGKLAAYYMKKGYTVTLCAADTFRAAAADQLAIWAGRTGAPLIRGSEGADPAAVVFDALNAQKARKSDILIIDTAGRLHNKQNLMNELSKIRRIIDREQPTAMIEPLLVLDSTTGQNGLAQAQAFNEAADIKGVILTKLDGTAKGGIAIAVSAQLGVPIKFVGVGETIDDLDEFNPDEFVSALF